MQETPERLIFNANRENAALPKGRPAVMVASDDPVVELVLDTGGTHGAVASKVERQARKLHHMTNDAQSDAPFGASLDWAHRCYKVARPKNDGVFRDYLYLFNVLVALEWQPDQAYLEQLKTAFRRASDFLFDVTDGWMAFGQVVLGGPELMDSADIQIMASTRLLPRSWVGAMHAHAEYQHDEKYMPIRLGRGLWNDNRRGIIPWDEPEAYRIIIHEWGHHALKLTDEYLETRQFVQLSNARQAGAINQPPMETTIVTLKVATTSDSIMATTEGTSEVVTTQWSKLHTLYSRMPASRKANQVRPGPGRLPLALPRFRGLDGSGNLLNGASKASSQFFPAWSAAGASFGEFTIPKNIPLDRCWVYVLKRGSASQPYPERVIAQGTLEARTAVAPFALLGATPGDTVVLIAEQRDKRSIVLSATVPKKGEFNWRNATPPILPAIDVIPEPVVPNEPLAQLRVRLTYPGQPTPEQLPEQVGIFPLGQMPSYHGVPLAGPYNAGWISAPQDAAMLDGHVLLRWQDGSLMISSFSQGGDGPNSSSPFPANPMNAGSADGNALLFMYKDNISDRAPNDVKVVTTLVHGLDGAAGGHERGYAFGIAANRPLPTEFHPTLLMYYDQPDEQDGDASADTGDLKICRRAADGSWEPLPTYLPPRFRFAIAPLDMRSGGALIADTADGPRVEYYKVCWVPRA
ncbi:MAG: hypothetical protein ABIV47_05620 [Roseiflexaceae bacterium]